MVPRRRIRRRPVSPLTGIASRRDKLAPASPPSTMPMSVCALANRSLRRALRAPSPGTRSAKIHPRQWPQRKRRTCTRHVTGRSCQGRSSNVRQHLLCTRDEARPQPRQQAWVAVVRAVISNPDVSSVRPSTCRPSGTDGMDGLEIGIALPSGHHVNQRPSHPAAPKLRMNQSCTPKRRTDP